VWSHQPPCLPPTAATSPRPPRPSALSLIVRRCLAHVRLGSANSLHQRTRRARSLHPRLPDVVPRPLPHLPHLPPLPLLRLPLLHPLHLPSPPLPPSCPRLLPPRTPLSMLKTPLPRSPRPPNQTPGLNPSPRSQRRRLSQYRPQYPHPHPSLMSLGPNPSLRRLPRPSRPNKQRQAGLLSTVRAMATRLRQQQAQRRSLPPSPASHPNLEPSEGSLLCQAQNLSNSSQKLQ
jgi:hypothetical protein